MAARSSLLPLLVFLLPGWSCAQTISLQVSAIPSPATRVVAVVDQGGLAGPLRHTQNVIAGATSTTLTLAVPAGGPYRVRAIAFVAGLAYPAILRSGKTAGVMVPNYTAVSAQISLAAINVALDTATPSAAPAGSTVTLVASVADSGDTGSGASAARVYTSSSPLPGNQLGNDRFGPFERQAEGVYRLSATTAAPPAGTAIYYQFAYNAWDFNDANNVEQPYLFWPDLNSGGTSLTLASQTSSAITVNVSGLPAAGNRVVVVLDGAGLQRPVRIAKAFTPGQTSTSLTIDVPAGSGYRVRVAAFTAGSQYPAILRTGKATAVQAPATIAVALADPSFTLLTTTPATAPAGSTVSLEATLVDSGDAAAGALVASVHGRPTTFTNNLDGTRWNGLLESLGLGIYRFSIPLPLPTSAATTYYQFVANAVDFNDPSGSESPHFCWPNPEAGQALNQISSTVTSSIRITVSGTPASATRLIALVDQGALSEPARAAASFLAGSPPPHLTVGVPPGGPYRVRLIALRSGLATPVILRSGKVTGVSVSAGVTATTAVALADFTVVLDAVTPTSGTAGAMVSVVANLTDPGETASGANASRLYGASTPFSGNLAVAPLIGLLEKDLNGTMKLTTPVALPGAGGIFYYQLAYEALDFSDANGVERPFFCWPNLEAAQALKQISSNANPSLLTISGKVTLNSVALSGVTVSLSGLRTGSVVTTSDGAYSFSMLPAGSYTVTAARSNFTFSPPASTVTISSSQIVNFVASQTMGTISIVVSGLPPAGNRIVAVVDGGAMPAPVRQVQDYTPGQSSVVIAFDAPVGGGYRIRVVAFAAGGPSPAILRTGKATGVAAPASTGVTLIDPSFTLLPATPASAPVNSTVSLQATLVDAGDAAAGVAVATVYSRTQPFATNFVGTESRGVLTSLGLGSYRLSVPLALPAIAATSYYQFAANAAEFNQPSGLESPQFCWPNQQTGQPLNQIASTSSAAILVTVSGTPATATRWIAVVDQGTLAAPVRTSISFAAGQPPAGITLGVPPGGPYRIRLIAIRAGAATPVILSAGKAEGVTVANGATAAATVSLANYAAALDPATPSSAPTRTVVAVIAVVNDPADTASGETASQLYGASSAFTQNMSPVPVNGSLQRDALGTVRLTTSVTVPAPGGALYYQVAFGAPDFNEADGTERPFFCWPNLEAGQALKQITPNASFTISGKVTYNGAPLGGVTVSLGGLRTATAITASDGAYAFTLLPPGGYTLSAARNGFTFLPASSTLTLGPNRTVDFSVSQIKGTIGVSRTVLRFGATAGGSAATATQEIAVDISDNLPVTWTVTSDKVWLKATPVTATGSGTMTVSLDPAAIPTAGVWLGTLTLNTNTSTSAKIVIQVYLAVSPATGAPFGSFDTPADGAKGLSSSVPVTGWALDDVGVKKVEIWRERIGAEPVHPNGLVYIGDALFVADARPDVAAIYSDKPNNYRAGWGYLMLTHFLPGVAGGKAGNGSYRIHAIASDEEGKQTDLGVKTITVDNATAVKPFGAIDSPAPGETITGSSYLVVGWALTPQPHRIVDSGKDIWIVIDGVFLGNVRYNNFRGDVASLFPTYANAGGSAGYFTLDTTRFANGMHSIAWVVTDAAGRTDGLGSRYFFVRNTGPPAAVAPRPVLTMAATAVSASDASGDIEVEELGRVELQLPPGLPWRGRLVHNEDLVPLPVGSTLDVESGVFVWQLAPGFLGTYTLQFDNSSESKTVRVVVRPLGSTSQLAKEGEVRF